MSTAKAHETMVIQFSVVHWYSVPVDPAELDEVTGGLPPSEITGPVEDGFEDEDTEDAVAGWLEELAADHEPAESDGFEIHHIVTGKAAAS